MSLIRRVVCGFLLLAGCLFGLGQAQVGATVKSEPHSYGGSLTATGVGPFDYQGDTAGDSYGLVTVSGTLTGFSPDTTYYLYGNDGASPAEAPVTSDSNGDIVLNNAQLGLSGDSDGGYRYDGTSSHPVDTTDAQYFVSTDPNSDALDPPDDLLYSPPTTLLPNPVSSPWRAEGGTVFSPVDAPIGMYNEGADGKHWYDFGPALSPPGVYCLSRNLSHHSTNLWCVGKKVSQKTNDDIVFQKDGNLVVYRSHKAIWSSGTGGHPGARLVLQSDGNLVIYATNGKALWQTHTYR